MDNATRSERTRSSVIRAALTIIARDGPNRLTLDSIAREGGISKGGLMHQFPTKTSVLKALLEYQVAHFEEFAADYMKAHGTKPEANLLSQIAVAQEAGTNSDSVAIAVLVVIAEDPSLLAPLRDDDGTRLEAIRAEAVDKDLSTLRWAAARGLAVTAMLGMCPLSDTERRLLFKQLLDSKKWSSGYGASVLSTTPSKKAAPRRKPTGKASQGRR